MNIFVLDLNPGVAAKEHCDTHVVKMIVETAQLVSTTFHFYNAGLFAPLSYLYKATHKNHPCAIWARTNDKNLKWLIDLGYCLCKEYEERYDKVHACYGMFHNFIKDQVYLMGVIPEADKISEFPLAMPDEYKIKSENSDWKYDVVKSYQTYYIEDKFLKKNIVRYKNNNIPKWFSMGLAKRALELPQNSELRKRIELFLNPNLIPVKINLAIKKGDLVEVQDLEGVWKIIKYSSNQEITIVDSQNPMDEKLQVISKDKILKIVE